MWRVSDLDGVANAGIETPPFKGDEAYSERTQT